MGVSPKSGEYIFATLNAYTPTRNEVIYTPLKKVAAGTTYSISFYVFAPGGNPAAVRNNKLTVKAGKAQTGEAKTGKYYIVSQPTQTEKRDILYTPFFNLKKGVECIITFYTHMKGSLVDKRTLDFTVGTEKDSTLQTTIYSLKNHVNDGRELNTVRFTPSYDGAYCFSFSLTPSPTAVALFDLEDFYITTVEIEALPKPNFYTEALYNLNTNNIVLGENQPLKLHNSSLNSSSYEWSLTDNTNATLSDANTAAPELTVKASGAYDITLLAKSNQGEVKTTKTLNIDILPDQVASLGLTRQAPSDEQKTRGAIPTFSTSPWDFITGPTHFYRQIAERYELPANKEISINSLSLVLTNLRYKAGESSYSSQHNGKFEVVVYGDNNGQLDESIVYGRYTSTMAQTFGTTGVTAEWGDMAMNLPARP